MSLQDEVAARSQEIATDAYAMSVGELLSLYRDGELEIHPEFQRFFRWTPEQKSRFVESLLLGLPIPSPFVSETRKGVWEVVDGLQRISTLLEVTGELRDPTGKRLPPFRLTRTKYLPSLEGKVWESEPPGVADELPASAKLKIKRSRLDLKIVLNASDPKAKYELFQRLNTGGSLATDQEVRNCVLLMVNRQHFEWLALLAREQVFRTCVPLSDRALEEQFDLELVVRFLALRNLPPDQLTQIPELGTFLTDLMVANAEDPSYNYEEERRAFVATFTLLADTLGEDSFRKFDVTKQRALGAFLISVFEVMAIGLGHCLGGGRTVSPDSVREVHQTLWVRSEFLSNVGSGVRASTRLPVTIPLGRTLFAR